MSNQKSPAVEVAKKRNTKDGAIIFDVPYGVRVKVVPVSAPLITDAAAMIDDPPVPMVYIESKGREEENPNDPNYLKALTNAEIRRSQASMDAMLMFGTELIDGMPEDDSWIDRLKWLQKHGKYDFTDYDFDDPLDREFLFKRYFCSTPEILGAIGDASAVSPEVVENIEGSFPDNETRS